MTEKNSVKYRLPNCQPRSLKKHLRLSFGNRKGLGNLVDIRNLGFDRLQGFNSLISVEHDNFGEVFLFGLNLGFASCFHSSVLFLQRLENELIDILFLYLFLLKPFIRHIEFFFELVNLFGVQGRQCGLGNIIQNILLDFRLIFCAANGSKGHQLTSSYFFEIFQYDFISIVANHIDHFLDLLRGVRLVHALQKER